MAKKVKGGDEMRWAHDAKSARFVTEGGEHKKGKKKVASTGKTKHMKHVGAHRAKGFTTKRALLK